MEYMPNDAQWEEASNKINLQQEVHALKVGFSSHVSNGHRPDGK